MKKIISILVLTAVLITIFSGCGNSKKTSVPTLPNVTENTQTTAPNASPNAQNSTEKITSDGNISTTEKSAETEYDPFAEDEDDGEGGGAFASFGGGVDWEEGKSYTFDYAPEINFTMTVHSKGGKHNFGLLFFLDGILQPSKMDGSEEKAMHIYELENEEVTQNISLKPVVGEKGDKLYLQIVKMFDPNFVPSSSNNVYIFSHKMHPNPATIIDVTETTGKTYPPICTDYVKEPVTDEFRAEFQNEWKAENYLDTQSYVKTLKNGILYTSQDYTNSQVDQTPFKLTDSVEVALYGGGEPCMYRVSMYINHELVKGAFDGMDYIDMEMSKNYISRKQVNYKNSGIKLNEYNSVYFVAVPFYDNYDTDEKYLLKSESMTLMG